jgi:trans-aconitate 2-methyltransferase
MTELLAARWPGARIEALDFSPQMVAAARERGIDARVADLRYWHPAPDVDVVVSNAALQWVPEHPDLLRQWVAELPSGAWLAFQVPGNFAAPSHALARELAGEPRWRRTLGELALLDENAVLEPAAYADLLTASGCQVDAWETTYLQLLTGEDPVLAWITGTALRPIRTALDEQGWHEFTAELAPRLRGAYPSRPDGTTWFSFRRVFVVARKG